MALIKSEEYGFHNRANIHICQKGENDIEIRRNSTSGVHLEIH